MNTNNRQLFTLQFASLKESSEFILHLDTKHITYFEGHLVKAYLDESQIELAINGFNASLSKCEERER